MSGYNYSDRAGCPTCIDRGDYRNLAQTTDYSCDQKCLCRFSNERSTKDQMYFDFYVLGKPMDIPAWGSVEVAPVNSTGGRKGRK